jgi:hypothetical protein
MEKKFNWKYAEKHFNPQHYLWLKMNHTQPLSEEEYVRNMLELKKYSLSSIKELTYKQSNLKKEYRRFKNKFKFFTK